MPTDTEIWELGKVLPEPILVALRIGSGFAAIWGWWLLARRSGYGDAYSAWGWRFLSLGLLILGFLVLAIPGEW